MFEIYGKRLQRDGGKVNFLLIYISKSIWFYLGFQLNYLGLNLNKIGYNFNWMKSVNFLNWLIALFLLCASVNFASCSDDDDLGFDGDKSELPGDDSPNPAGDDFYNYVNGAWHASLEDTDESQGYSYDQAKMLSNKVNEFASDMPDVKLVLTGMHNSTSEENEARVEEIISEVLDDIETKEDAYQAIGECVKNGLIDGYLKMCMIPLGDEIGFTLVSLGAQTQALSNQFEDGDEDGEYDEEDDEDDEEETPADQLLLAIIEGMEFSGENFDFDESVLNPNFLNQLTEFSVDQLKDFLQGAIQQELLPYCGDEYAQQFAGYPSRADFFDEQFENLFTYSLSRKMAEVYVSDETKAQYMEYCEYMRDVFALRIQNNAWLSDVTKQQALHKLENMQFYVGSPDTWYDEYTADVEGEQFIDDIVELKSNRSRIIEATIGKDAREEVMLMSMYAPEGNSFAKAEAAYVGILNTMFIYPAFLMEPEYAPDMDEGKMFAAFYVIGHEMTHGFDVDGAEYDAFGKENNWWTPEDKAKFVVLNEAFSTQIGTLEVAPGIHAPTENTIGENVADLGGLNIAYDALMACLNERGVTGEDLKEKQRNFFEYHAHRYREQLTEEDFQDCLNNDEHSLGIIRVNGMVQHMDAWYDLYNVKEGDALYLPADKRITIW